MHAQIEQLRAGRERLAETIDGVRRSVDGIADDLFTAEDQAREAAEVAGRTAAERADDESPDDLTALLADVANAADVEAKDRETTTSPVPETAHGMAEAAPGGAAEPTGKVDALFAKLRAGHEGEASEAQSGPGAAESGTGLSETSSPTDPPEAGPSATTAAALEADVDIHEGGADRAQENDSGPPADRPPAVVHRDELIAPAVTTLSRRLKRTLQDTQNDMLDHLRSNGSRWSPAILPEETEQVDGLTTAVLPVLEDAAQAGSSFAGGTGSGAPSADAIVAIAHGLAEEVVVPLRRRLSADGGVTEAGEVAAVEHVGAAFREWRGPRVERLAGDYVVAAFSLGSVAAVQRDRNGRLEWVSVPGSGDAPCPDCEDNGLAGPQPPGDEFPTGHRHPPAHSGCRCLVAPAAP